MSNPWSREETIIAFNVYCKIPFKNSHNTHPTIVEYARILGRTPSALNMKVGNIGRLDPDLRNQGITGLRHGARMEEEVWSEFYGDPERLAFESERLIAERTGQDIEKLAMTEAEVDALPQGEEREVMVRRRVNQSFFRSAVVSAYNLRCCISGVGSSALLDACHIVDWSEDKANRTNPKNGLCLNPFFHRAYDKMLLAITPDLNVVISEELLRQTLNGGFRDYLRSINGTRIAEPDKFRPDRELLKRHYERYKSR